MPNTSCSTKASRSAGSRVCKHHEERESDRVGHERLVLRVHPLGAAHDRIGHAHVDRLLAPRPPRAQHVERQARDDGRQPSAQVLDLIGVGAAEPQPRLLHGVVRFAQRAEHPVGHRPQMGSVLLETLGQPLLIVHRSHPFVASCQ